MHIFISTTYNVQEIKVNFIGSGSSRIGDLKYIYMFTICHKASASARLTEQGPVSLKGVRLA